MHPPFINVLPKRRRSEERERGREGERRREKELNIIEEKREERGELNFIIIIFISRLVVLFVLFCVV